MKHKVLRTLALLLLVMELSSCYMGRWRRYHHNWHYGHRQKYYRMHHWHNRDW